MELFNDLAAGGAVIGLLVAALWWLKRRGWAASPRAGRRSGRRLEVVERAPLGTQHALHLVRVGERGLLLTSSPTGCAVVGNFAWSECGDGREERP